MKSITLFFAFVFGIHSFNWAQETLKIDMNTVDENREIKLDHLKELKSLSVDNENYEIVGFTISMIVNEAIVEAKSENNLLTQNQIDLLTHAKAGEKVYIENIKAKHKNGEVKLFAGLILSIQ